LNCFFIIPQSANPRFNENAASLRWCFSYPDWGSIVWWAMRCIQSAARQSRQSILAKDYQGERWF